MGNRVIPRRPRRGYKLAALPRTENWSAQGLAGLLS